ncbi:DUF222 domain-containing protein [Isoptericola sp. b441]|uniref:DUF222 domain-containing protein n=1 Tax=Actinotalea lenta TaxID=3064654 RepID=A0ABT9D4M6_9CELL|nr:HNH endonuclease signature motif containing protein [Isoptericola sp. b441]MDO8105645.1 DUF222 domain-containing protein [Isoptericola sp. b441]
MAGGERVAGVLSRLRADVADLAAADLSGVDGADGPSLHAELARLAGQITAVAARVLARVEDDGRWQAGPARTFGQWVARREGTSVGAARRQATLGRALDHDLPATAAAVVEGALTLEHAQVLARAATSPAHKQALASSNPAVNEAWLVRQGRHQGADQFARTVARWAQTVDAGTAERDHQAAAAREHLTLSRRGDGLALHGFLTREHGEVLATALRAVGGVPPAEETRTVDQRHAAALVDTARLVLDRGLAGTGQAVRPHLSVHVGWEAFHHQVARAAQADGPGAATWLPATWHRVGEDPDRPDWAALAPAQFDDGTPVPPSVLARLACDSEITRVIFGPDSAVLDVGRAQRTFTGQQRRAVIARDRTCQYPGCHAPPTLGEIHHVRWWQRDTGPTAVPNGILLCFHHHDRVHQHHLHITRDHDRWLFTRPDGHAITHHRAGPPDDPPLPEHPGPPGPHRPPDDPPPPDGTTARGRPDVDQGELPLAG